MKYHRRCRCPYPAFRAIASMWSTTKSITFHYIASMCAARDVHKDADVSFAAVRRRRTSTARRAGGWAGGRAGERTDGQRDGLTDGRTGGRTDKRTGPRAAGERDDIEPDSRSALPRSVGLLVCALPPTSPPPPPPKHSSSATVLPVRRLSGRSPSLSLWRALVSVYHLARSKVLY